MFLESQLLSKTKFKKGNNLTNPTKVSATIQKLLKRFSFLPKDKTVKIVKKQKAPANSDVRIKIMFQKAKLYFIYNF